MTENTALDNAFGDDLPDLDEMVSEAHQAYLQSENERLKVENAMLRQMVGMLSQKPVVFSSPGSIFTPSYYRILAHDTTAQDVHYG